jgi:putative transposase
MPGRRRDATSDRKAEGECFGGHAQQIALSADRTLLRPTVRVARWDLSTIDLVDPRRGTHLATLFPVDKEKNAERRRRTIEGAAPDAPAPSPVGVAPLLRQLMAEYAATGLPPAYVSHEKAAGDTDPTGTQTGTDTDDHTDEEKDS